MFGPGGGEANILLDNLVCEGTESSLANCNHSGVLKHNCSHSNDVGVICKLDDQLSLAGIRRIKNDMGRVNINVGGRTSSLCGNVTTGSADVICSQLKLESGAALITRASTFGPRQETGFVMIDLNCSGNETNIFACDHRILGISNQCDTEELGVVCSNNPPVITMTSDVATCSPQTAPHVIFTDPSSVLSFKLNAEDNKTVSVSENSNVNMTCVASGRPAPRMRLVGGSNRHELMSRAEGDIESHEKSRELSFFMCKAQCEDSGDYTCEVDNGVGNVTQSVMLLVTCNVTRAGLHPLSRKRSRYVGRLKFLSKEGDPSSVFLEFNKGTIFAFDLEADGCIALIYNVALNADILPMFTVVYVEPRRALPTRSKRDGGLLTVGLPCLEFSPDVQNKTSLAWNWDKLSRVLSLTPVCTQFPSPAGLMSHQIGTSAWLCGQSNVSHCATRSTSITAELILRGANFRTKRSLRWPIDMRLIRIFSSEQQDEIFLDTLLEDRKTARTDGNADRNHSVVCACVRAYESEIGREILQTLQILTPGRT
ncbi:hypothetical protein C0Q70_12940 [Pomacea canaliculata]|uniref:SRCR domain-containing protein n=1 Tax=Pomacea canaliculata TaxID=400727 RepID=A0A2T7P2Y4_POMCA|nr:hypothetical protein C0Q70_12940 [Pomacea canaliculata]